MNPGDRAPVARGDSFEVLAPDGPELTAEEAAWPVAAVRARADSFEVVPEPPPTEVLIRVRCDGAASADEVGAFVERVRAAVEGVRASGGATFPVRIDAPAGGEVR